MTELDLLQRVREATGPDRELDAEIDAAMSGGFPSHLCHDTTRRSYSAGFIHNADDGSNLTQGGRHSPSYTASIDAALALVERKLPGWGHVVRHIPGTMPNALLVSATFGGERSEAFARTEPLAIIAALLTALADKGP